MASHPHRIHNPAQPTSDHHHVATMTSKSASTTTSPLLPSVFPNEDAPRRAATSTSRASSVRASPALKDDLALRDSTSAVPYVSVTDENEVESLLPPHDFQPFFALVEDAASGEVSHPAVHYVFEDDDPEVVTAASLRSLGVDEGAIADTVRRVNSKTDSLHAELRVNGSRADALPPVRPGTLERYVLVDVAGDGRTIIAAKSLSADWAVTGTSVGAAPTFDRDAVGPGRMGGLMLKIEGMGGSGQQHAERRESGPEREFAERREAAGGDSAAAMALLMERLRKKMDALNKVMLDGEEGTEEA